jgi:thiopurine S-methyltransferase
MNGPPFAVSAEEITALYADAFGIERLGSDDVLEDSSRFREAGIKRLHETTWRLQRNRAGD